jgi:hypothetical protein
MSSRTRLRQSIAATAALLALVLGWVGSQAYPSSEAVRLRNALLLETPSADVGRWGPGGAPGGFLAETRAVPPPLAEAARNAVKGVSGELARSRALVAHLLANARDNTPVTDVSIERTYRAIVDEGRGYCSDYIDAFVALALASDVPVRTWAFSFDGFGGHGHVVAEVHDAKLKQWVMLDVFNNVQPVTADGAPLAARDFRERFAADPASVRFVPIGPGRVAYWRDDKLREYYTNGIDQWYFWNGNNVVTRGTAAHYRALGAAPGAAQLLAVALGEYPRIVPLPTATNQPALERMKSLGVQLRVAIMLVALLTLALLVEVLLWLRAAPGERAERSTQGAQSDPMRHQKTTT